MSIKLKRFICIFCATIILVVFLGFAQALLVPKYMSEEKYEGALTSEYYSTAKDNDVIFIGDCEIYESFIPAVIWKESGIKSYLRGSPQQLIWQSYYLLEDTLRYETPQAVVFNVLSMKYGEPQDEAYNRMTIDGMRWSQSKNDCIKASMTQDESFLSYVFPLLRFHSRIGELQGEDFRYMFGRNTVSYDGYLMKKDIVPMKDDGQEPAVLLDTELPETCFSYLDKMRLLCEEKGIDFILIKSPTNTWKYWWYDEWDKQISEYADSHGLDYFNLINDSEKIGLDMRSDTYDGGVHLNVYGAYKLSRYFAGILSDKCGITPGEDSDGMRATQYEKFINDAGMEIKAGEGEKQ